MRFLNDRMLGLLNTQSMTRKNAIYLRRLWLVLTLSVFCTPLSLHAKSRVSVEPYLGYSQISFSVDGTSDDKFGTVLGGKGGIHLSKKVFAALDFHFGGPYFLQNNDNEFTNTMWGLGATYLTKKLRLWVGYYFSNVLEDVESNLKYSGMAFKVTLGYMFKSKLAVNFDYIYQEFTEIDSPVFTSFDFQIDSQVIMISVSAPLGIK